MEDMVIVGRHAVREAITAGHPINKILTQGGIKRQQINEILKSAKDQEITVQTAPKSKLDSSANAPHQGVAAPIVPYECIGFDQFLKQQKEKEDLSTVLILNGLEDPHNLESILRTADAMGIDGVIIPKCRSVILTQIVAKTSTGTIEHVPVIRATNLTKTIDELKDDGSRAAGTEANNATDCRNLEVDMSLATVIGNEGQGMSCLVSDKCDFYIKIPMAGHVNSLSAPIAASLVMHEVFRRRHDVGET